MTKHTIQPDQRLSTLETISPFVRLAHDFTTVTGFSLPTRQINDHALLYFQRGSGTFHIEGKSHPIDPGMVFIIRPNTRHSFTSRSGVSFRMFNLHFDPVQRTDSQQTHFCKNPQVPDRYAPDEIPMSPSGDPLSLPLFITLSDRLAYERAFQRALRVFLLSDVASRLRLKGEMIEILALLLGESHRGHVAAEADGLDRALHYIHDHHARPLTLEHIAQHVALSRSHFARLFKQRYGVTPMKHLMRVRIEIAKTELLYQHATIKAIASQVGFASVHHFTRVFSQLAGLPPGAFRRTESP